MSASDFVTLKSGLVLPMAVIELSMALENRGVTFSVDAEELIVGPRSLLTDADRIAIRKWREHLKAVVNEANENIH